MCKLAHETAKETRVTPDINPETETERIVEFLRTAVYRQWRRRGAVLGISGGVDSSVTLALCVRAFGPERVTPLLLPERDSSPDSERLARDIAAALGVTPLREDLEPGLAALGCYDRRDAAVRRLFPDYDPTVHRIKIVLPPGLAQGRLLNLFYLVVEGPDGSERRARMPRDVYLDIVAASNMKQRARMLMLYYHAERRHYAVVGTANKNEHDQGFFVKHGDGGVDIQPIAHLYKTQVYRLAEYLGVPEEVRRRPPTSDTYSASCTQEEFFFRLPFPLMDALWSAQERGEAAKAVAARLGLGPEQVQGAFDDFRRKRATTEYLRTPPLHLPAE
jgi:NAD+ synthase